MTKKNPFSVLLAQVRVNFRFITVVLCVIATNNLCCAQNLTPVQGGNGKCGYVNVKSYTVVSIRFETANSFSENFEDNHAKVQINGAW